MSLAVCAITLAARTIPLRPIDIPAHAVDCHVCGEMPGTKVATFNCDIGTTHDTSEASVDAAPALVCTG